MQVLPIVTRVLMKNFNDLRYLRGLIRTIIHSESLEEYKTQVRKVTRHYFFINLFASALPPSGTSSVRPDGSISLDAGMKEG